MRLLLITQKVDKRDPVLGFMHGWISEFSKRFESLIVVCLEKGEHSLPGNVKVISLGKEDGKSRGKYVRNFYGTILRERKNYDAVFVHMNEEYVILGGIFWKILGKKIYMWRNHYAGSPKTSLAAFFCDKIFCTSEFSYTARYKKTLLMPVGVDTDIFSENPNISRKPNSILFFGRLAPSKHPDLLIEALGSLQKAKIGFIGHFLGPVLPIHEGYISGLKKRVKELGLGESVSFLPAVSHSEAPKVFGEHEIVVNLSASGMFDKTLFEAAACGTLVLASSRDFAKLTDKKLLFKEGDANDLAGKLEKLLALSADEKRKLSASLRHTAIEKESLLALARRLSEEI